jgi:hypothetical protein
MRRRAEPTNRHSIPSRLRGKAGPQKISITTLFSRESARSERREVSPTRASPGRPA